MALWIKRVKHKFERIEIYRTKHDAETGHLPIPFPPRVVVVLYNRGNIDPGEIKKVRDVVYLEGVDN